jgi:23S rRNA pseudouridine955/2504/2580 synthase
MKSFDFARYILQEDEEYLIVNKPENISTLEDRASSINMLAEARKHYDFITACHRLDKETSGVLVFAKSQEAYRHLSMQLEDRKVSKIYYAVVHGASAYEGEEIYFPIYQGGSGKVRIDPKQGKEASTLIKTTEQYRNHSLIMCKPITGKKHQIRVHLAHVGHPLIADTTYGGAPLYLSQIKRHYRGKDAEERPMIGRTALHAFSIAFKKENGEEIQCEAPLAKDFELLLKQLRKYGR